MRNKERGNVIAENSNLIAEKSFVIFESGQPYYYKEKEIYVELENIGAHLDFIMTVYCYLSNNSSVTRSFFGLP